MIEMKKKFVIIIIFALLLVQAIVYRKIIKISPIQVKANEVDKVIMIIYIGLDSVAKDVTEYEMIYDICQTFSATRMKIAGFWGNSLIADGGGGVCRFHFYLKSGRVIKVIYFEKGIVSNPIDDTKEACIKFNGIKYVIDDNDAVKLEAFWDLDLPEYEWRD